MRELKFRVWDIDNKRMIYPGGILDPKRKNSSLILNLFGNLVAMYEDPSCSGRYDFIYARVGYNLECMQYTGLKDKNDKKIYEGDVLREEPIFPGASLDKSCLLWVVTFEGCSFGIRPATNNHHPDDYRFHPFYDEEDQECHGMDRFIIIGNIYENPGLLNHE